MIAGAMLCAAIAAWCAMRPDATQRMRRALGSPKRPIPRLEHLSTVQVSALTTVAAVMSAVVIGGLLGLLAGAAVALIVVLGTRRHARRDDRDLTVGLTRQAPVVTELLSAIVGAGASITDAVGAVAKAVPDPASRTVDEVRAALALGATPQEAWARVPTAFAPIAAAICRSQESGAPLAQVLALTAEDLRRAHRGVVQAAARAAGVRVVGPLALCFLPAYLLLGVVPIVASLARGLFT